MADTTLPPVSLEIKKPRLPPIPDRIRLEMKKIAENKSRWTKSDLNLQISKLTDEIDDLKDQLKLFKELVYSYLKKECDDIW
jgi:hypothetical protein